MEESESDRLVGAVARNAPATDDKDHEDHDDERCETHAEKDVTLKYMNARM